MAHLRTPAFWERSESALQTPRCLHHGGEQFHCAGLALQRVDSFRVKASQYDHSTGQCAKKRLCDRWGIVAGKQVQRDLYSAFLIAHVTGKELNTIDREACVADWMNFLKTQEEALRTCDKSLGIF